MKFLAISFTLFCLPLFAQQESVTGMFWNTNEYYNPGTTGIEYKHRAIAQYRNQWTGINGAPTYIIGSYGMKSEKLKGGIGVNGMYETIGLSKVTKANLNYSYHLNIGNSILGIGVQAGLSHIKIDYQHIYPGNPNDPGIPNYSRTGFNSAAGIYYKWKNLRIGASATQLIQSKFIAGDIHYWLTAGYDLELNDNITLTPEVLVMTTRINGLITYNLRTMIYKKFWAGISYRHENSIGFMAGYDFFQKFRVGYNYEQYVGNVEGNHLRRTHEAVIGFILK